MAQQQPPTEKKLNSKSTKEEILEAYHSVVRQLQEKRKSEQKPEEQIQEKKIAEVVQVADSLSTEGIGREIGNLRTEIGKTLIQLSDRLEQEIAKYESVKKAIESKEKELKEIYEIEKNASSLAALIDLQRQKREQFDVQMAEEKQELEEEIETKRAQWEREVKDRETEIKETATAAKKKQEREAEEYRYAFEREKALAREQFDDEKLRMHRELDAKKEAIERELAEREKAIAEREAELSALREKAAAFPAQLDAEVKKAVADAIAAEQRKADFKIEILKKEFEGERKVLSARNASLEQSLNDLAAQNAKLSQQIEKSYGQVQDIAVKAIEGSANAKAFSSLQQTLAEQSRKAAKNE